MKHEYRGNTVTVWQVESGFTGRNRWLFRIDGPQAPHSGASRYFGSHGAATNGAHRTIDARIQERAASAA